MPPKTAKKVKTIEETYQKKTPREHILHRADTYVGSIELEDCKLWVYDDKINKIVEKTITYNPGLYKIFDELVVNTADHRTLHDTVTKIDFTFDRETDIITIKNNGPGIPVVMHKEYNVYIPTLIFSHLLTGSNFDDEDKNRRGGGRNGYGLKTTNIFSKSMCVETVDSENKLKFTQTFRENMSITDKPKITTLKSDNPLPYTKITFTPDLARFGMDRITDDMYSLFTKRAYDLAGVCKNVTVSVNEKKIKFSSFKQYIDMYKFTFIQEGETDIETEFSSILYSDEEYWQVGVVYAPEQSFKHVSFVNGICTYKGGTHVDHVTKTIVDNITAAILKKQKKLTVKPQTIRDHLIIFINASIVQPSFGSQVKDTLNTKVKDFGSKCELTPKFLKSICNAGIVDHVISSVQRKDEQKITKKATKTVGGLNDIIKLEDAPKAGTALSEQCTLILTEGDSAKGLAIAGLSVVDKNLFGVFPLKGKLLNVRETSPAILAKNEEINNICRIMNLKIGEVYENRKKLRYGKIMIMTDQDVDGFHIQGLLMNFIHYFWPSLMEMSGFIVAFTTPVIKASKGKETIPFYNMVDYNIWKENNNGWKIKYYKGLGTSNKAEAKEYFLHLDLLTKLYESDRVENLTDTNKEDKKIYTESKKTKKTKTVKKDDDDDDDEENSGTIDNTDTITEKYKHPTTEAITLAFEKGRSNDRKIWVKDKTVHIVDHTQAKKTYSDFINKEMRLFSQDDCDRSIASIDGLKIALRKILKTMLDRKIFDANKELRVATLAANIVADTAYHHGEMSLVGAIKKMAQDYVGANNLNLLVPSGQYGTRNMGGKDAASERYIQTYLEILTPLIYRPIDNDILEYNFDDGVKIEPKLYAPIIPMLLVNGTAGIGTGFMSDVTKYDVLDVIKIVEQKLQDKVPNFDILPHFKGFTGSVLRSNDPGTFLIYGKYQIVNETTIRITELPIGSKHAKWPEDYKVYLDAKVKSKKIVSFTADLVSEPPIFHVTMEESVLDKLRQNKTIWSTFNLMTRINTNNMNIYDSEGELRNFPNIEHIFDDFYDMRYKAYDRRQVFLTGKYKNEVNILEWEMKFINDVIDGTITVFRTKKAVIIERLVELGYPKISKIVSVNDGNDEETTDGTYNYLTDIKLFNLTEEKIAELQKKLDKKMAELKVVEETSIEEQWQIEIDEFKSAYNIWINKPVEATDTGTFTKKKGKSKKPVVKKVTKK